MHFLHLWLEQDQKDHVQYIVNWRGKPVKSINKAWHNALNRSGFCRRIRPYDLRHAFATHSLSGGADIKCIGEIMGHKDVKMILETYQHIQEHQKRDAIGTIPDFIKLNKNDKRLLKAGLK